MIDPPRKGCDASVIDSIALMSPKHVVYVSCDPETLARDLKLFCGEGLQNGDCYTCRYVPENAACGDGGIDDENRCWKRLKCTEIKGFRGLPPKTGGGPESDE